MRKNTLLVLIYLVAINTSYVFARDSYLASESYFDEIDDVSENLANAYNQTIDEAILTNPPGKPCTIRAIELAKATGLKLTAESLKSKVSTFWEVYQRYDALNITEFDRGAFSTLDDRAINAVTASNNFPDFIQIFTGISERELKDKIARKEIDENVYEKLELYYEKIKGRIDSRILILNKDWQNVEYNCSNNIRYHLKISNWNYPVATFQLIVEVDIMCSCRGVDETEVNTAIVEFSSTFSGLFTTTKFEVGPIQNPTLSFPLLNCCTRSNADEGGMKRINPPKNSNFQAPEQTIGSNLGVGFRDNFNRTSICVGAEYLRKINSTEDKAVYLGLEIDNHYSKSTNDFDVSTVKNILNLGAKLQLHTPITNAGMLQWVNGLDLGYIIGSEKQEYDNSGSIKDKINGYSAGIYTGLQLPIERRISIGAEIDVLKFKSLTYTPDAGGDNITENDFSLLLNKGNKISFNLRYNLNSGPEN